DGSGRTVALSLEGRGGNDTLLGGSGDDGIRSEERRVGKGGGAGNGWMTGEDGADGLSGGAGDDALLVDSADTSIDGGAGYDSVSVVGMGGVTLELAEAQVEWVFGSRGNVSFDGSGRTVALSLEGRGGNDTLLGGSGDDGI